MAKSSNNADRRGFLKAGAVGLGLSTLSTLPALTSCAMQTGSTVDNDLAGRLARPSANQRVLIKGGTVISMDAKVGDFAKGDVLVEGKRIAAVAPSIDAGGALVVDASDMIVIPGFVDTHRHAWMAALRGFIPNHDIGQYMGATHRSLATHYRAEDIYIGNLMTALACIEAGVTCVIDNSHNSRTAAHSDAAVKGLMEAGIRALYASGAPRTDGVWDKQWPRDIDRLRSTYFSSEDQLLSLAMYADLVPELIAFARQRGLKVAVEMTAGQLKGHEALALKNELGPWAIYNHCNGLPDLTWQRIRDSGGKVNICARSDAQYLIGQGYAPIQKALDHQLRPALSIDGEASYSSSMFSEMAAAYLMQRAGVATRRFAQDAQAPRPMTQREILACATLHGAECAGLERKCGTLTPGKEADLVMIRHDAANTYPLNNAIATVVSFAEIANIDSVMVAGRMRKFRGRLLDHDIAKLRRELVASRDGIFTRAGYKLDVMAG